MKQVVGLVFVVFAALACQPNTSSNEACRAANTDKTLLKGEVKEPTYQNILLAFIEQAGLEKVRYYFERRGAKGRLILRCEGPDFCGWLIVEVPKEDDITSRLQNESGYGGAEIEKLEFTQDGDRAIWLRAGAIID
jgi:hypothetical protein